MCSRVGLGELVVVVGVVGRRQPHSCDCLLLRAEQLQQRALPQTCKTRGERRHAGSDDGEAGLERSGTAVMVLFLFLILFPQKISRKSR